MVNSGTDPLALAASDLDVLFPFHIGIADTGMIAFAGRSVSRLSAGLKPGACFAEVFEPLRQTAPYDAIPLTAWAGRLCTLRIKAGGAMLRGQMHRMGDHMVFLGSPWLETTDELQGFGLTINDFAIHDPTLDLLQVVQVKNLVVDDLQRLNARLSEQRARLKAQEAEARKLALIAARTDNAVVLTDARGCIEWVNDGFTRLTEYRIEDVKGRTPGAVLQGPETDPATIQYMRSQVASKQPFRAELVNYSKSGRAYWLSIEVQPILDEAGEVTNFMAIESDVTARRQADEDLRTQFEVGKALASASTLLEAAPAVVKIVGEAMGWEAAIFWTMEPPAGQVEALSMWQRGSDSDLGLLTVPVAVELGTVLPARVWQSREQTWVTLAGILDRRATGALAAGLKSAVALPVRTSGDVLGVLEFFSRSDREPEAGRQRTLAAVAGQLAQFIERSLAEAASRQRGDELQRVNTQLAQAMKLKDAFLASMGHELKTPLTGILGLSEALIEQVYGSLNEKQIQYLRMIENSGQKLLSLLTDLLELANIGAGRTRVTCAPVSIRQVCEAGLRRVEPVAAARRQNLNFQDLSAGAAANVDAARMAHVLEILLGNAAKFTQEKGEFGLRARVTEEHVRFEVWDKGVGIAAEDLPKLFQPFVQLDDRLSRKFPGTGLGLALAKEIVHLHGGSIRVVSEIGAGSCFTVELPLGLVPAPKPEVSIERLLVLLVDDNPVNLIALCDYLEHNGCRVEMAENGAIAVEKTQALRPDIVLMDVQMPVMDGLEAMRRIRAWPDPFFAELPILAVTALTVSGDRELCLNAGANDYMGKPVSPKAVWVRVQALTAGRGGRPSTRPTP